MKKSQQYQGFTLAEVLITLGIIGVVAAMTIPTLIQDYQTKVWATSASVFEKKLETALKTMNTQQTLAGHTTTMDFVEELSKHFKITRICSTDELSNCFSGKINWNTVDIQAKTEVLDEIDLSGITSASDLGQKDWGTEIIGAQFANGVTGVLAYNPNCYQDPYSNQVVGTNCLAMAYDTSGFKSPNEFGKDLRGINAKLARCAFKYGSTCFGQPFVAQSITTEECNSLKDQLGIKNCYNSGYGDNWAGAVKTCGGVNNMPTSEHLAQIVRYVYTRGSSCCDDLGAEENTGSGVYMNEAKYTGLGFPMPLGNDWTTNAVWSNKEVETNSYQAYYRFFHPNSYMPQSSWSTAIRSNTSQAFCIINN